MRSKNHNYDGVDIDISKKSTDLQLEFFKKCIELAHKSNLTQKHGCVIVKKNQIISCGYNFKLKNNAKFLKRDDTDAYSVHAEISTLKKVKQIDLTNCEMYVVRIGPHCTLKYSLPCQVCSCSIQEHGIRKVYYSINSSLS
jgi:tRNA(Arg) A34 adenosine deaminase TadA